MKTIIQILSAITLILVTTCPLHAQEYYLSSASDPATDSIVTSGLKLRCSSESFLYNNEYEPSLYTGYSLPGFRFSANLEHSMYVLHGAALSVGAYTLRYWGASRYPAGAAYKDIAFWSDDHYRRLRVVPLFRAEIKPTAHSRVILGSIYGGAAHRLIEPMYNPELNLTADPEAGFQYIYSSPRFRFDTWIDWQSFIYKRDDHQEAFTFGLSSAWQVYRRKSADSLTIELPVQITTSHRGGEYNLVANDTVHTWGNAAIGLNINFRVPQLKNAQFRLSAYALGYNQRGEHYPLNKGYGFYTDLRTSLRLFDVGARYWYGHDWVSPQGMPLANGLDAKGTALPHGRSSYINLYAYFNIVLKKDVRLGAMASLWIHPLIGKVSYSDGIYLAFSPSFMLVK